MRVLSKLVYSLYLTVYVIVSSSFIGVCLDLIVNTPPHKITAVGIAYDIVTFFTMFMIMVALLFIGYITFKAIITPSKIEEQLRDLFNKPKLPF
jgi:ABC-type dipeptide/oligopeptide/nickel transport system permease component